MHDKTKLKVVFQRFLNSYELETKIDTNEIKKKSYINKKQNPQYCRFCDKFSPEVSFKTDAHLAPKLLGSKYLLSHFECDNCNSLFKEYENDLANFMGILRSIAGIKGKAKNPKYSSKELQIFEEDDGVTRIVAPGLTEAIERGESFIMLNAKLDKHVPTKVYKALFKIALCLINEDEVPNFRSAYNFLTSENDELNEKVKNSMKVMRIFVPGPSLIDSPHFHLWKRKNDSIEVPEKIAIFHIKNIKYFIPMPLNSRDNHLNGKQLDVPMCPIILPKSYTDKYGEMLIETIDLSNRSPVIGKEDGIGMNISNVKKYSR